MAITDADRLAEAETALHKLLTGTAVVEIRHGQNELMRFAQADVDKLKAYIAQLRGGRVTTVRLNGSKGLC